MSLCPYVVALVTLQCFITLIAQEAPTKMVLQLSSYFLIIGKLPYLNHKHRKSGFWKYLLLNNLFRNKDRRFLCVLCYNILRNCLSNKRRKSQSWYSWFKWHVNCEENKGLQQSFLGELVSRNLQYLKSLSTCLHCSDEQKYWATVLHCSDSFMMKNCL